MGSHALVDMVKGGDEMSEFKEPNFKERKLELRFENYEICIYGTKEGLQMLSDLISKLVQHPKQAHIHLEDYDVLTESSQVGTIAIFEKSRI